MISTAFQTKDFLLDDKHIVFLGWDTWKWDFMMLALNLELDSYSGFRKNIMISLIDQDNTSLYQERLNYKALDRNPLDIQDTGLHSYTSNGNNFQFFLQPAYEELALIHADSDTAIQYNSNIYYLEQGLDWKQISDSLRPDHKVVWQEEITFTVRNNVWMLLLMALIISLYWFLSDRLILKS